MKEVSCSDIGKGEAWVFARSDWSKGSLGGLPLQMVVDLLAILAWFIWCLCPLRLPIWEVWGAKNNCRILYSVYFSKMFFVFRAVITEEFKVPDKMVGFSKYPHYLLFLWFLSLMFIVIPLACLSPRVECFAHCVLQSSKAGLHGWGEGGRCWAMGSPQLQLGYLFLSAVFHAQVLWARRFLVPWAKYKCLLS